MTNLKPKNAARGTVSADSGRTLVRRVKSAAVAGLAGLAILCTSAPSTSLAAEGASSHYLPGAGGDIFLAVPPEQGLTAANTFWFQTGSTDVALLEGRVSLGIDLDLFLNLASLSYTFEKPVLGGRYTIGTAIPFGYADLEGALTGPLGGRIEFSDDSFDLSDIAIIPFQMNWTTGRWSFKLWESIVAPTGGYDASGADLANLGRNYWSFDTVGAVTWFNPDSGTEVSIAPGVMFNTENPDTDYETGTEFHVDFVANQFLSETFALGLRGYYYRQLTGDSGSGATLGDFKSESFGIGPGFVWIPGFGGGRFTVLGKWMPDLSADNRFESDYVTLTGAWKF
ncbi:MAG: transporter [Desulfobacteraceae bacterium]|nr:transporter [Desulfobacteraceae bacterium]